MSPRLRELLFALAYLALGGVLIYGAVDRESSSGGDFAGVLFLGASFAIGILAPRWWVFLLPLALVFIAIPAGYAPPAEDYYEEIKAPIWLWLLLAAPFVEVVVAVGLVAGWVGRKLVARSS